jgi:adenine-specific DNA-methyltransferase
MSIDKLDLQSLDLVKENFERLAALFPNCVTETSKGKAIDFDLLKQELNHEAVEGTKERYRLEWPGKREAIVSANVPTNKTLRPVRKDSVDFDNTENIFIEGDNLDVLKLLQESYLGQIKMIYIDPPYNTGSDFVYKDRFSQEEEEYLIESGQKDEYKQRLRPNPETSGRYHSDWLSMMYPRLKLARNLLTYDGSIFISIDDNEVDNLRKICDEIFGESNFVTRLVWRRRKTQANLAKNIAPVHDFILVYARSAPDLKFYRVPFSEEFIKKSFSNPDNDPRGLYQTGPLARPANSTNKEYELKMPNGRKITAKWSCSQSTFDELVRDNRLVIPRDGEGMPRKKIFLSELEGLLPNTWLDNVATNDDGAKEIADLFGSNAFFSYPKPTKLIEYLMNMGLGDDGIILDFFAGSSSTAHAVLNLNSIDKKSRKFIMVQLQEPAEPESIIFKEGFEDLAQLSKERIRRAAKKIKKDTKAQIDYGFRVYSLADSNMQDIYYKPQDYKQETLDLFADNVKPGRTPDDLLAQVMLDWGLSLSLKITQVSIAGKEVFKVGDNSLHACFDQGIDEKFAKAIAKEQPLRIVFRDNGFKNDTAKINVKQLLKQLSPDTEMKVI